jgi:hypothetical protein
MFETERENKITDVTQKAILLSLAPEVTSGAPGVSEVTSDTAAGRARPTTGA